MQSRFIFPIFESEYLCGYISLCLDQLDRFLKCLIFENIDVKIEELISNFKIDIHNCNIVGCLFIVNENDVKQAPGSKSHVG